MTKYHAKPTVVDGIRFASKREASRYGELKLLEKVGEIRDLKLQPIYKLVVSGELICRYRPDFTYWDHRRKMEIVEDCKGFRTPVYKLKCALFTALYGQEILET